MTLTLTGDFTRDGLMARWAAAERELLSLPTGHGQAIVIDAAGLGQLDTAGLAVLIRLGVLAQSRQAAGQPVTWLGLPPRALAMARLSGLEAEFPLAAASPSISAN